MEKVQGARLKPSSCCLRQSQTVDLTLNGVREHMQRRGKKEHDRWTYESTAGLWKIVTEEATRGRSQNSHSIYGVSATHWKATVSEERQGAACVARVSVRTHACVRARTIEWVRVWVCVGLKWSDQRQVALRSHLLSLVIWVYGPWAP